MLKIRIFENQKQVRQFWTLVCSAVVVAISMGEFQEVIGVHKIFVSVVGLCSLIILYINCKEIYNEKKDIMK